MCNVENIGNVKCRLHKCINKSRHMKSLAVLESFVTGPRSICLKKEIKKKFNKPDSSHIAEATLFS